MPREHMKLVAEQAEPSPVEEVHPSPDEKTMIQTLVNNVTPEGMELSVIGQGGEHLVLKNRVEEASEQERGHAQKVIKIDFLRTIGGQSAYAGNNIETAGRRKALAEELEQRRVHHLQQRRLLRRYFGFHALPAEKSFVEAVPMTPALFNKLKPESFAEKQETPPLVPALVTIQRQIELDPEKTVDLTDSYAESTDARRRGGKILSERDYERGHNLLLGKPYESLTFNLDEEEKEKKRVACTMYPSLARVKELQEKDPQFREQLRNFAREAIQYANGEDMVEKTRNPMLDFLGKNNIVMTAGQDGAWKPLLLDPMTPVNFDAMSAVEKQAAAIMQNPDAPSSLRPAALNVLHFIRYANALATIAGIEERVQVADAMKKIPAATWRRYINWEKYFKKEQKNPKKNQRTPSPEQEEKTAVASSKGRKRA